MTFKSVHEQSCTHTAGRRQLSPVPLPGQRLRILGEAGRTLMSSSWRWPYWFPRTAFLPSTPFNNCFWANWVMGTRAKAAHDLEDLKSAAQPGSQHLSLALSTMAAPYLTMQSAPCFHHVITQLQSSGNGGSANIYIYLIVWSLYQCFCTESHRSP